MLFRLFETLKRLTVDLIDVNAMLPVLDCFLGVAVGKAKDTIEVNLLDFSLISVFSLLACL